MFQLRWEEAALPELEGRADVYGLEEEEAPTPEEEKGSANVEEEALAAALTDLQEFEESLLPHSLSQPLPSPAGSSGESPPIWPPPPPTEITEENGVNVSVLILSSAHPQRSSFSYMYRCIWIRFSGDR